MPHGQISLDLIFAIIAFLIFLQFGFFLADNLALQQNRMSVRNQEQTIALQIKSAFNACRIADVGLAEDDCSIEIFLPEIHELGAQARGCEITVRDKLIEVSHIMSDGSGIIKTELALPEFEGAFSAHCSEALKINC